jgi:hopene-associated glycosyltransferase HpnB
LLAVIILCVWLYLFFAHGKFWFSTPELPPAAPAVAQDVDVVVPARDEAGTIGPVIASLLSQDYGGTFRIILVDDSSTDGTADRAGVAPNLEVITGRPKPDGWSGKLWALSQGVAAGKAPVLLLTDADIVHDPRHLATLVARLEGASVAGPTVEVPSGDVPRVDMVSEMVRLNCSSWAERSLVPAFVYFFQMLYPFAKVNDPASGVAAAAGGTVLIRREALQRIGGIEAIRGALIDDVTLGQAVKRGGGIYLGHSGLATSIRPYPSFGDIWAMISRTAFTQLRHSALLLVIALVGLTLVWWAPLLMALFAHGWQRLCGLGAFMLGALSFMPTLVRYRRSPLWALVLPLIALFYMAATLDSAVAYWRGRGARWKGRDYKGTSASGSE